MGSSSVRESVAWRAPWHSVEAAVRCWFLEQHFVAGGLTQTFSREGFTWDVGLHYLGEMHEGGGARRVLDWLSDEAIHFSPVGAVYDTVHFPEGFEVLFHRTQAALKLELQECFPASRAALEAYFSAVEDAGVEGSSPFPPNDPLAWSFNRPGQHRQWLRMTVMVPLYLSRGSSAALRYTVSVGPNPVM
jgi:phytoene dehydrogenase-like protein